MYILRIPVMHILHNHLFLVRVGVAFSGSHVVGNEILAVVAFNDEHMINWPRRAEIRITQKSAGSWHDYGMVLGY